MAKIESFVIVAVIVAAYAIVFRLGRWPAFPRVVRVTLATAAGAFVGFWSAWGLLTAYYLVANPRGLADPQGAVGGLFILPFTFILGVGLGLGSGFSGASLRRKPQPNQTLQTDGASRRG